MQTWRLIRSLPFLHKGNSGEIIREGAGIIRMRGRLRANPERSPMWKGEKVRGGASPVSSGVAALGAQSPAPAPTPNRSSTLHNGPGHWAWAARSYQQDPSAHCLPGFMCISPRPGAMLWTCSKRSLGPSEESEGVWGKSTRPHIHSHLPQTAEVNMGWANTALDPPKKPTQAA